jgi:hypothetical protein
MSFSTTTINDELEPSKTDSDQQQEEEPTDARIIVPELQTPEGESDLTIQMERLDYEIAKLESVRRSLEPAIATEVLRLSQICDALNTQIEKLPSNMRGSVNIPIAPYYRNNFATATTITASSSYRGRPCTIDVITRKSHFLADINFQDSEGRALRLEVGVVDNSLYRGEDRKTVSFADDTGLIEGDAYEIEASLMEHGKHPNTYKEGFSESSLRVQQGVPSEVNIRPGELVGPLDPLTAVKEALALLGAPNTRIVENGTRGVAGS